MFISRAYNTFHIDHISGTIEKRSENAKLGEEIAYYASLPDELKIHFPRIVKWKHNDMGYHLEMEMYAYHNLARPMLGGTDYAEFWEKAFDNIEAIMARMSEFSVDGDKGHMQAMFVDKTESEYKNLLKNNTMMRLTIHPEIEINGKTYKNFNQIWPKIKDYFEQLPVPRFQIIHGDLCLSNILAGMLDDTMVMKLIDPRGSFGTQGIYGDPYYDYAKLAHSCDGGYEYFIYDKFALEEDNDFKSFSLGFTCGTKDVVKAALYEMVDFEDIDITKMNAIQGSIFISMVDRHYDNLQRQKAMYLTGVKLLNEVAEVL